MPASCSSVDTEHASKYLQQLCKHWSHRLEVEFDPQKGIVHFDAGRLCRFEAQDGRLAMRVETHSDGELERTQNTVIVHLKRFAFREEFGEVAWQRAD
ncbi:MAG: DUF2218 domain-containing protein [Alphaproteobacteria bacterium]|nr:DUF2218 domain-containing protein [Alphaproteobacteria bacterium]